MEIELLTLHTSQLEEMKQFYTKQLGFSLFSEDATHFRIKVGSSLLEFTNEYVVGEPYYHFAFNLPSNQFQEAKTWLKAKTTLLLEDGEDEADFSFWPAHACYFEDPAGNIVELIARYNVNPTSDEPFSVHQILNVSEIGLIVKDAPSVGEQFKKISAYKSDDKPISNDSLSFMKAKDNGVYVLLTGEGRRWLFSEKKSKIFPLRITLRNQYILGVDDRHEFFITKKNDEF